MPALNTAQDILTAELKAIYSAEKQLARAIPRMSKKVSSDRLREMLERRLEQGETLIDEIEDALDDLEAPKARPKNLAAEGLLEDASQHMDEIRDERLVDPVLLSSVQKIEHYCIAAWGSAAAYGRLLGEKKVVKTMERVLGEGKKFDDEMTKLAEEEVNPSVLEEEDADDDVEEAEKDE